VPIVIRAKANRLLSLELFFWGTVIMMRSPFLHLMTLCLLLTGCGQIFVGFVSNPGFPTTASGTVVTVQLLSTNGPNGVSVAFTAVTLNNNTGFSSTFDFCGDQRSRFPINQQVRVEFISGVTCSTLNGVFVL
jgi:uncharacterized protein YceK